MTAANSDKTSDKENDPDSDTEPVAIGATRTTAQPAKSTTATPTNSGVQDASGNSPLMFQSYVDGNGNGVYKIIKTVGKGNFAKVKLAIHVPTDQEVAIKVIDKTKLNTSAREKLYREVKIMKLLNHPNIVKLFQVIESERTLYLVMEYASGGELFDHLVKNGKMSEKDARVLFRQLVSAIQYCHGKSVVHRDLKAENLLLDQKMNIKIADFGFSTTFDRDAQLETFCGSPPYAAPELFRGKKYTGPEVDSWSLGVVLFTLISGYLPFDGGTLKELRDRVLQGKYRVPHYTSIYCENLIRKFLVLNPDRRLTLSAAMEDRWINMGHDENNRLTPFQEKSMDLHDFHRLDILKSMGHKRRDIEQSLKEQKFDDIYCTYMLLGLSNTGSKSVASLPDTPFSSAVLPVPATPNKVTVTQVSFDLDNNVPIHSAAATSRPIAPRLANAILTPISEPPPKFTKRTTHKTTAPLTGQGRYEPSSQLLTPLPKTGASAFGDVKPTLLSAQRKLALTQRINNTPTRKQHTVSQASNQDPGSTRRLMNHQEKAASHFKTSPIPSNDIKMNSRIGFFSKLSARLARRNIQQDLKEINGHVKKTGK